MQPYPAMPSHTTCPSLPCSLESHWNACDGTPSENIRPWQHLMQEGCGHRSIQIQENVGTSLPVEDEQRWEVSCPCHSKELFLSIGNPRCLWNPLESIGMKQSIWNKHVFIRSSEKSSLLFIDLQSSIPPSWLLRGTSAPANREARFARAILWNLWMCQWHTYWPAPILLGRALSPQILWVKSCNYNA